MSDRTENHPMRSTAELFLRHAIRARDRSRLPHPYEDLKKRNREAMRSCALKWRYCRDWLKGSPAE